METIDIETITEESFNAEVAEQLVKQGQVPGMEDAPRGQSLDEQGGTIFHIPSKEGGNEKHIWLPKHLAKQVRRAIERALKK